MQRLALLLSWIVALTSFSDGLAAPQNGNSITSAMFEQKMSASYSRLKQAGPLTVEDAVQLVRISNTLFSGGAEKRKAFEEFEMQLVAAASRLTQALGEWIPNHGFGIYFKQHDLNWGGVPGNIRDYDHYIMLDIKSAK